jgi:hypothetical protein
VPKTYRCIKCGFSVSVNNSEELKNLRIDTYCYGNGKTSFTKHTFANQPNDSSPRNTYTDTSISAKRGASLIILGAIFLVGFLLLNVVGFFYSLTITKGSDPKDYFGTYYFNGYTQIYEFTLESNQEAKINWTNGMREELLSTFGYEYVSSRYAYSIFNNDYYREYDAILVYSNEEKNQARVLWVLDNTPFNYSFLYDPAGDIVGTKSELTFSEIQNDPRDYYGTFRSGLRYITLNENGSAVFFFSFQETNYKFIFVNEDYIKWYFSRSNYNKGILLYDNSFNSILIGYENGDKLYGTNHLGESITYFRDI